MRKINLFILHPILFAIYPILYLYSQNKYLLRLSDVLPSILCVLGVTILLIWVLTFILDIKKASIINSLLLVFIFSYGYIYKFIERIISLNVYEYYVATIWLILMTILIYLVFKTKKQLINLNIFLNTMALVLIIFPLLSISFYGYKNLFAEKNTNTFTERLESKKLNNNLIKDKKLPDIYYIILDGYGRKDILKDFYNYDNSFFLDYLNEKGFYIATESKSNYMQTPLSLASSLNLNYIDSLSNKITSKLQDRQILRDLVFNNKVATLLQDKGYNYIHVISPYIVLGGPNPHANLNINPVSSLNEFEYLLLQTSILRPLLNDMPFVNQVKKHAQGVLNTLSSIENVPEMKSPTFTFAHIVCPHPPFVFDEKGNLTKKDKLFFWKDGNHWMEFYGDKEKYVEGYKEQITFLNKKMISTIDKILLKSNRSPIIILQADHGPGSMLQWEKSEDTNIKERMSILNAYYLPNSDKDILYKDITPVNSFRAIFNYYFGTNYKILEDKSYFSTWSSPYNFIKVLNDENNF